MGGETGSVPRTQVRSIVDCNKFSDWMPKHLRTRETGQIQPPGGAAESDAAQARGTQSKTLTALTAISLMTDPIRAFYTRSG